MPGGGKNGFYEYSIDPICNIAPILKGTISEIIFLGIQRGKTR